MDLRRHPLLPALIRHPHRTAALGGAAVGFAVAVLTRHTWRQAPRPWALVVVVMLVAAVWAVSLVDAHRLLERPGSLTLCHLAAAVAMFGCVPETGQMPAIGVLLGGTLLVEIGTRASLPLGWHQLCAALLLWSGLYGATGRGSAVVGALFACWPVVLVALAALLPGRPQRRAIDTLPPVGRLVVGGIGAVAAVVVARTGADGHRTAPAVVSVVVAAPASAVVAALWVLTLGRRRSRST